MARRSKAVTIRDVARRADVSVATVSRYINASAPVSTEVAGRLEQVMDELNYTPHVVARHLATRKTQSVGLLLTNMHNDFFAPLFSGIESVVREHNHNLLVATHNQESQQPRSIPIGPHNTDGMLVFADSLTNKELARLHESKFPVVLIHRTPPPGFHIPCVTVENKAATCKIIEHLIQVHSKKRIIFMRGPVHQEDSHWREVGYQTALAMNGIKPDPALVLVGGFESTIAYHNFSAYLQNGGDKSFDAVFAGDDDAAIGVLNALNEAGYRVPEDIAVVGFDDSRLSPFLSPPLTTVRAPTEEVGRVAARQLFHILQETANPDDVFLLPTDIVIRSSCGCI